MEFIMVLATLVFLIATILIAFSWWALSRKRMRVGNWLGCAAVFLWVAGSGVKLYLDHTSDVDDIDQLLRSSASLDWRASDRASATTGNALSPIGTVDSLVGGLEAKLTANPNDAKGWALLAQSYSFIGDTEGAETAIARAVELGFEEQGLRDRVEHAKRDAPAQASL
jgi:hypothetical protein